MKSTRLAKESTYKIQKDQLFKFTKTTTSTTYAHLSPERKFTAQKPDIPHALIKEKGNSFQSLVQGPMNISQTLT